MILNRIKNLEGDALKAFVFVFFAFLFGNILILDLLLLRSSGTGILSSPKTYEKVPVEAQNQTLCPASCITRIEQATASSKKEISDEEIQIPPVSNPQLRESLITLGTGTNTSSDYTDVPTTQVYIDPSRYGTIKKMTFEVSVAVPTANQYVYVRLYNLTDKYAIWNSELYMPGGPSAFLESVPLVLPAGNKLYVVQMKSQLKHLTNLNQARLRIESY